jgi:hypothetical protein
MSHSFVTRRNGARRTVFVSILAASVLSACGGGGGGGGGGTRPSDTVPAPVSQNSSTGSGSSGDSSTPSAPPADDSNPDNLTNLATITSTTSVPVGSSAGLGGAGITPQIALANGGTSVRVTIPELGVNETFSSADVSSGGLTVEKSSVVQAGVTIQTVSHTTPGDSVKRTLTYTVPGTDGFNLRYSSLGIWDSSNVSTGAITQSAVVSYGSRTPGSDIPTTGTANYVGFMVGNAVEGSKSYSVSALATAAANFGSRSVAFMTSGSMATDRATNVPIADASGYNLTGTLSYAAGVNALSGTLTTANGKSGAAAGTFYGPQAAELGVTFRVTQGGNQPFVGGAALKRP